MKTLFITLFLGFTFSLQAQITSGTIEMGVTDFKMKTSDQMPEGLDMGEMMKSVKNVMYFKPGLLVQEMNMMGMMNTKSFIDKDSSFQYMDMMGQKMLIKSSTSFNDQLGFDIEKIKDMYKVKYDKTDQRKIQDFNCYRADITINVNAILENLDKEDKLSESVKTMLGEMKMTAYITEDIDMPMMQVQQFQGLLLDGAPLYTNIEMQMMSMTMEAISFDKNVDPEVFVRPAPGTYKVMTIEDIQSMGMGSGGFGF